MKKTILNFMVMMGLVLALVGCQNQDVKQAAESYRQKAKQDLQMSVDNGLTQYLPGEYSSLKNTYEQGSTLVDQEKYQEAKVLYDQFNKDLNAANGELNRLKQENMAKAEAEKKKPVVKKEYTYKKHTVTKGQSLWTISRRKYGTGFKWHLIQQHNKGIIPNSRWIYPGQVIKIPFEKK